MGNFTMTVDIPEVALQGDMFKSYWQYINRERPIVEAEIKRILEYSAKNYHEYTVRTGRLKQSTRTKGSLGIGDQISLYIDGAELGNEVVKGQVVGYAEYIISRWYFDDPFIDEAFQQNKAKIDAMIKDLYINAVRQFNMG